MSSVWVSSRCQCAVAVANQRPISSPTSSSSHCASANIFVPRGRPLSSGSGLSDCSRASSFGNNGKLDSTSSFGHPRVCWSRRGGEFAAVVDASSSRDSAEDVVRSSLQQQPLQRRELVRAISSWILLPALINAGSSACGAAAAAEEDELILEPSTTEAPAKIGLIEKLLERSKANKAKYDQERLDAYYRRNFSDYFQFLKGGIQSKDPDKLTETEKGILKWLEKNQ